VEKHIERLRNDETGRIDKVTEQTDKLAAYEAQTPNMLAVAIQLDITTPDGEARAESWLIEGREFVKKADAELVEPWRQVKRDADAQMKKLAASIIDPVTAVVNTLKGRISTQRAERQRIAEEAARKAQAELNRKAEQERQAAMKAAEKLKTPELREERLAQAEMIVAPVVQVPVAKPTGSKLATVVTWGFEIVNAGEIPREYMIPDESKIGAVIRASKGSIVIPGVRAVRRESVR
jgi:hypothetical protein